MRQAGVGRLRCNGWNGTPRIGWSWRSTTEPVPDVVGDFVWSRSSSSVAIQRYGGRMPLRRQSRVGLLRICLVLMAAMLVAWLGASVTGVTLWSSGGTVVSKSVAEPSISSGEAGSALAALATVPVKGRAPRTGYDRALFGPTWADVDRNGCDTRNDVLRRDLTADVLRAGTHGCVLLSGTLLDPYTATTISFVRGQGSSTAVQIDHVVALSDAWQKGAQQLSAETRRAFANDSLNLLAVDGLTNQGKGDGDAATWLPPNKAFRCPYAARQVAVKAKYGLWVTSAERDALGRILATCPTQPLPTAAAFVLGAVP